MTKPHIHAALIKAWADGALIEVQHMTHGRWCDARRTPQWHDNRNYRIKEVPKAPVKFNTYRPSSGALYSYAEGSSRDDVVMSRPAEYTLVPSLCYEEPAK